MKIVDFRIQHEYSFNCDAIIDADNDDGKDIFIIHSEKNSTGKTTLLRAILYTLGFDIKGTERVKFSDYEFFMKLYVNGKTLEVKRYSEKYYIVERSRKSQGTCDDEPEERSEEEYELPRDEKEVWMRLFNISNTDILDNLLGAIYFDQDRGWTWLNHGKVIGKYRFSVERFVRGLNDVDSGETHRLESELHETESKISQYKLVRTLVRNQEKNEEEYISHLDSSSQEGELVNAIMNKRQKLSIIKNEINALKEIIRKNEKFVDYIEHKKIYVKMQDGSPMQVTKENLFSYDRITNSDEARMYSLQVERDKIINEIAEMEAIQKQQSATSLFPSTEEQLDRLISQMKPAEIMGIDGVISELEKGEKCIKEELSRKTNKENLWVDKINATIKKYSEELHIPDDCRVDIFTKTESKSGAHLYELVFIHRLAYIQALSEKTGLHLPIFCDSPSGGEVESSTICSLLGIVKRDFSEHQLFLVSIVDYGDIFNNTEKTKFITMDGTLFNREDLLTMIRNE